jgi:RimJ/RimL family protein N-acetyltransferase
VLTLRPTTADDLPILFEHQRDPEAARMAAFPSRAREAFMTHWRERVLVDAASRVRTVVVDGEVVGHVVAWTHDGVRTIGYWIDRAHWGRGVATAALAGLLAEEPIRPLHARVAVHNVGSIRVLEKCGFFRVSEHALAAEDGVRELIFRREA